MNARSHGTGGTFAVAMVLLGLFAVGQMAATIWAGVQGRGFSTDSSAFYGSQNGDPEGAVGREGASQTSRSEGTLNSTPRSDPRVIAGGAAPISANPTASASTAPASSARIGGPRLLLPPGKRIEDPNVLEAIEMGIKLREQGDTQGALGAFRRADSLLPGNPAVLHELARTYDAMALGEKAAGIWNQVLQMGEEGAGDYHALAAVQLGGGGLTATPGPQGTLRLGQPSITRQGQLTAEEIQVRIPVHLQDPQAGIDPADVMIYVYFFDRVDGTRIEQTNVDDSIYRWRSGVIDWRDASEPEVLEAIYRPQVASEVGEARQFHGCIVKLFYRDELQDMIAEPRTLYERLSERPPPRIDDTLFRTQ